MRKAKHDRKIARAREKRRHADLVVPGILGSLAVAPSMLLAAGGFGVYCCSLTGGVLAGQVHLLSLGLSSDITGPMMRFFTYGTVGGGIAAAAGIGSTVAVGIPISAALEGAAQLSEWNFNRQQAQSNDKFVEQS